MRKMPLAKAEYFGLDKEVKNQTKNSKGSALIYGKQQIPE